MIGSANELPGSDTGATASLELRRITKLYIAATCAAAMALLLVELSGAERPRRDEVWMALGLVALGVLAGLFPLDRSHKQVEHFDSAVALATILIFPPGFAMLIAGGWMFIGLLSLLGKSGLTAPETYFNTAQCVLKVGAAGLAIAALGWDSSDPQFDFPEALLYAVLAGIVFHVVEIVLVSGVVALESRVPILQVLHDGTMALQWAEIGSFVAQVAVGLLAAMLATYQPWALALLVPVGIAVYLALQQHVEIRHRVEWSLSAGQRVAQVGSFDWDLQQGDQRWSDELFRLFGLEPKSEASSRDDYVRQVHPDDVALVDSRLDAAETGDSYELDHRILLPTGEIRSIHSRGNVRTDRSGKPRRVIGTVHDITDRKRLEDQLAHQAQHDPLTGLPNRAQFTERLDAALNDAGRRVPAVAVLFLDLDRFKLINDTLGHEAGDQLLIQVGQRLQASVRPEDLVARLGGDEFTVLLVGADAVGAEAAANRIIAQVTEPMTLLENREIVISTSIGIVLPDREHESGAELVRDADTALYRAKERGRNQWAMFDGSMGAETRERLELETDLRRALERDELSLVYQPKVNLATGRTEGVESFLRWNHPTRGTLAPGSFIEIADETGLIHAIGAWAIAEACREAATWEGGESGPWLSVNLSARQFFDPALAGQLTAIAARTGFSLTRLRLEVAESTVMKSAEATIDAIAKFEALGARVIVDDFGTGYSNLASLQRFTVDMLQLDRSYVLALGDDPTATTIAQAVIGLSRGLGMRVVAEGIERPEQLRQLIEIGCELGQGNLFMAPSTGDAIRAYLAEQPRVAVMAGYN